MHLQLNFVGFDADHDIPIGSVTLGADQPTVTTTDSKELLGLFADWSGDIIKTLGCMRTVSKWSIQMVYPPLKSYIKGHVALIGDAVGRIL